VSALYRPQPDPTVEGLDTSAQEHVRSYLQWLDPDRAGLPDPFRAELRRMLARYGVGGLGRTPPLGGAGGGEGGGSPRCAAEACEVLPGVTGVLERRLRDRDRLADRDGPADRADRAGLVEPELRGLLGRLAAACQARYPEVADLARDLVFRYFDEPVLERAL